MPVLGLVLRLEEGAPSEEGWRLPVQESWSVTLGPRASARCQAAVLEVVGVGAEEEALAALEGLPGVCCVDVVYADFSELREDEIDGAMTLRRRRARRAGAEV